MELKTGTVAKLRMAPDHPEVVVGLIRDTAAGRVATVKWTEDGEEKVADVPVSNLVAVDDQPAAAGKPAGRGKRK